MNEPLSAQQQRIVALVAQGYTDKAIALRLGIAPRTVRDYLAEACRKVGAVNRVNLAYLSGVRGLVTVDMVTVH
jgi:DNA-binding NarL/FixJ family response regulator